MASSSKSTASGFTPRRPDPYPGPTVKGIDVSTWQGHIVWPLVAKAWIEYAWCRLGDRTRIDHTFFANYVGARRAGIVPFAYHFMRPDGKVEEQAKLALELLANVQRAPGELLAVDVERGVGVDDPKRIAEAMLEYIAVVESTLGHVPVVYAGAFFSQAVHDERLGAFPLWTPDYRDVPHIPAAWKAWSFWQYSDKGRVAGIQGDVDLDVFRGDRKAFDLFRGAPSDGV